MGKTAAISVRIDPAIKDALDAAAIEDRRSVASLVEKILDAWLREHGYLTPAATADMHGREATRKRRR